MTTAADTVTLTIDGRTVQAPVGATILEAARSAGIAIPTLCHWPGLPPQATCQVCVVALAGQRRLVPSCATVVQPGMDVQNDSQVVRDARRTALELLLSDHTGDCGAPCQTVCPAHMDIPTMLRQIVAGDLHGALETVKRDIALPAVLGRICPAPCEAGCRRKPGDAPVSVCMLKRYVADEDLESTTPWRPRPAEESGKRVAILGAGPAGLAAAYYLRRRGHACELYDAMEQPGGAMRFAIDETKLPRDVLDGEINVILSLGVTFHPRCRLGAELSLDALLEDHDAVLLATGAGDDAQRAMLEAQGVRLSSRGVAVDAATWRTSRPHVFAAGGAVQPIKLAVRSVADGKQAAEAIDRFLCGAALVALPLLPVVKMGRLDEDELASLMCGAAPDPRLTPDGGLGRGYTHAEAVQQAGRCLQCDCTCGDDCRLRRYAAEYGAQPQRYAGTRRRFRRVMQRGGVIFEPGKCIACGLCVTITRLRGAKLGLTFVGRGFDVQVTTPFGAELETALDGVARECVEACPTGALSFHRNSLL